ncbi:MAG TPA: hypothetical protein VFF47_07040 [Nitrospirota bacterium]|nr:hypothetical protein [Nitrospirota bacterium]
MNRTIILTLSVILIFILNSCGNKYMIRGTQEFGDVTHFFEGGWKISSLKKESANIFNDTFDKGSSTFYFDDRVLKYELNVSRAKLDGMAKEWRKRFPDAKVEEVKIVINSVWEVDDKGKTIIINEHSYDIAMKGSGKDLDKIQIEEAAKLTATEEAERERGRHGALEGAVIGFAMKKAKATSDLHIKMPERYTFRFSGNKQTLSLCAKDNYRGGDDISNCIHQISLTKTD